MTHWNKSVGAFVAAALAATGACSVFGGDEAGEGGDGDAATRLVNALNESTALQQELSAAELRIVQTCLEDQGQTVHDQYELAPWDETEQESLVEYYPHEEFLPSAEEAEKWGFSAWTNTGEGSEDPELDAAIADVNPEGEDEMQDVDNSEFETLSPQEQFDWYAAFYGEEYATEYYGWALEEEGSIEEAETAETAEGDAASGEIDVEGGDGYSEPKPGGCKLEMIHALYGEPEEVTEDLGDGDSFSHWSYGLEMPTGTEESWQEMEDGYRAAVAEVEDAFLTCLSEGQLGEWEFDESGYLPIWEYFIVVYNGGEGGDLSEFPVGEMPDYDIPEIPADLPSDYEGRKAYEIEMATGFVACGEETGYSETAGNAWDQVQLDFYLSIEQELYAYQESVREAIDKAQGLIEG
ncbi:hypothetical protein [Glycomyces buryatensis]|uniref:Uncharacterized protein n=1 Tax=Glycomyces buryatensis TaxID=2570927 RepID=A0A4V4HQY5_9ACTN|nr:hypothetical protein [Glycomyces buryatensis]THV35636.1 hypothetical protein FAB82_22430 [Glycomyces buryatensis]